MVKKKVFYDSTGTPYAKLQGVFTLDMVEQVMIEMQAIIDNAELQKHLAERKQWLEDNKEVLDKANRQWQSESALRKKWRKSAN